MEIGRIGKRAETSVHRGGTVRLSVIKDKHRKGKCKAAKKESKSLKTRLAKMKESRDRWKTEARQLRKAHASQSPTPKEPQKTEMRRRAARCR
mgnify:CR=1 FL=1